MTREQRALLAAAIAVVFTVLGGFVLTWFRIDAGATWERVDLQGATTCTAAGCHRGGLDATGFYGDNAMLTLWGSVLFAAFAAGQVALRRLRGFPSTKWTKKGYFWGVTMAGTVLTTAYLFPPDAAGPLAHGAVSRTWAPLLLAVAQIAGVVALYYATDATTDDDVGEYKPIVIAKPPAAPPPSSRPE